MPSLHLLATPQWEPGAVTYILTRFITLQLNPNLLILFQLFNNLCNCLEIQERDHWNRSWVIKSCNSTDWNYTNSMSPPRGKAQTPVPVLSFHTLPKLPPAHNSACGSQAAIQRDFPFYTGCFNGRHNNCIYCLSYFVPQTRATVCRLKGKAHRGITTNFTNCQTHPKPINNITGTFN